MPWLRCATSVWFTALAGRAWAQEVPSTPAPESLSPPTEALPVAPAEVVPAPLAEPMAAEETPEFETLVMARKPMTAASSLTVRDRDFLLRPHSRPADILMVTPGLFVGQHAGGGKANQYFLRGFDADHGTDVALSVDGIPVNLLSHGHGQGYADLHWLIPEVVERIEVNKGPYFAEYGDLATAGAINLVTRGSFQTSQLSLGGGMLGTYRGLVVASPELDDWRPFFAAEVYGTNGPFEHGERLKRYNLFSKISHDFGPNASWSLAFTSYGGGWRASGQIPLREVRAGRLDRWGSIDPSEGGNSQRHSVYTSYRLQPTEDSELSLLAYLAQYRLALYSNFTFFSADPLNGDMIEQDDVRTLSGLRGSYRFLERLGSVRLDTTLGLQMRNDSIENALYRAVRRERLTSVVDAQIEQGSLALYGQEEITWTPWLRSIAGVRFDYFGFDVKDRLEDLDTLGTRSSGVRQASQISPKGSLVLSPLPEWDVYLNFGVGFHSNDARGVVRGTDPVTPLTRAVGEELGSRVRLFDRLDLAASMFHLQLDSENVWVGDEGTTEARGPTRRYGMEVEARLELLPWLFADADATLSRARFTQNAGNANAVALAPRFLASGGVSARHPSGLYGRLGVLSIADRPATEDRFLTAEGFTRLDATLGYQHERFELNLSVENLLDTDWREAQFANVSRLPNEASAADCPAGTRPAEEDGNFLGCEDLHFTPGAPIHLQASATFHF
jgi:outer membrane receptor protein involved in Fe transport